MTLATHLCYQRQCPRPSRPDTCLGGSTVTKYYYFGGQRIAMNKGGTLYYLHSDHLGSTVLTTQGSTTVSQQYCAYGRKRSGSTCPGGNSLPTGHTFTGQKLDGTGLQYYNARYYDPSIGAFISPDTIVPDATNVFAYNRYMYTAGNPLRLTDSSGHVWETVADVVSVGYDVYDIYQNGWSWGRAGALAADVSGAAVPFMPAPGACVRWCDDVLQYGDEALAYGGDAAKWVGNKADEGWQATKRFFGYADTVCSFSEDTLVATNDGLKPISTLKVGEWVLAYNEATGETDYYPILDTFAHNDPQIVFLTINGETITTTPEHPFYEAESAPWVVNGELRYNWTSAEELKVGDFVRSADGMLGRVSKVEVVEHQQVMHNLTVADAHTYFVGEEQWLVHNSCNLGKNFFNQFSEGQGFSAAIDLNSGITSMLPSTDELVRGASEIRDGVLWVPQYGGHAFVGNELIEQGASRSNIWGYVGNWTGERLEITNWNSGVLNNPRAVPVEIRAQIVEMLRKQTGLEVVDIVQ